MADNLGLALGDMVTLISPDGDVTPMGTTPRVKGYPVVAIFEVGMSEYDASVVLMPFAEAQLYFNVENAAQSIEISSTTLMPWTPFATRSKRRRSGQSSCRLAPAQSDFLSALQVERNVVFMIVTLVVVVAALNIISGLIMLVRDKSRDVAILRTMGATRRDPAHFPHDRIDYRHCRNGGWRPGRRADLRLCRADQEFLLVAFRHRHLQS
jgi:lipoprotein-releasing system permease protein